MDSEKKQELFTRILSSETGDLKIAAVMISPIEYKLAYSLRLNVDREPLEELEKIKVQIAVKELLDSGSTSFKDFDRLMDRLAQEFIDERKTI